MLRQRNQRNSEAGSVTSRSVTSRSVTPRYRDYLDEIGSNPSQLRYTIMDDDHERPYQVVVDSFLPGALPDGMDISAYGGDSISAVGDGALPPPSVTGGSNSDGELRTPSWPSSLSRWWVRGHAASTVSTSTLGLGSQFMQESQSTFAQPTFVPPPEPEFTYAPPHFEPVPRFIGQSPIPAHVVEVEDASDDEHDVSL